jgi:transposase
MKKLRRLLQLKYEQGLTHREIGRALNLSAGTVSYYAQAALREGLTTWPLPKDLTLDTALAERIGCSAKQLRQPKKKKYNPNWSDVTERLKQRHMTLQFIWQEYKTIHGTKAPSYAQFTRLYKQYCKQHKVSMRLEHQPGEKAFIDYSGSRVPIYNRETKAIAFHAELFILVLGASDYTFVYATKSQQLPDWIAAHVKAFEFLGGTPKVLVPDNLKSGITDSCQFEPQANPTYADMAAHYQTVIIPARPRTPQDKSKAENGVLLAQRWLITRLDKSRFYSLASLNNALNDLVIAMNARAFQKRQGSRYSQFIAYEKAQLQPLPVSPYEFARFATHIVPPDYHLRIDGHYYSVPYTLVGERVDIRYTHRTVEMFYNNQREASHLRSEWRDKKTTQASHRPPNHQAYEAFEPALFLSWASSLGQGIANAADAMTQQKKHPEQVHKLYYGFKKLVKQFGQARMNQACYRACALSCLTFKSIQSILEKGLDKQAPISVAVRKAPEHMNVRGPDYYRADTEHTNHKEITS